MSFVESIVTKNRTVRALQRGRLFRKYFLLILALVCGALLISGAIGVYFSYQENKNALAKLQYEKAVAAAARIEQFIQQIETQVAFAGLPQLGAAGMEQRRLEFLKLTTLVKPVTNVAWIDGDGREQLLESRLTTSTINSGRDRSSDPAVLGAKPGKTWYSPVTFHKETEPYMSIAVRGGKAVTVADVNLKFIWDVITRIRIGKQGKAYVVDAKGLLVADPDIGLVLRKTDLSQLRQVKVALDGREDEVIALLAQDATGREVLSAYAPIESLGWKVFVEQPVAEVYATLNATIVRTGLLILAGLLLSVLAALWLAGDMVSPIRTLEEGAARIGEGYLDQKIVIKTGDELEALADQFNRMTERLRESYAGLERKVEERTAELQETLDQQTATSETLKVISSSPTDVQPVFGAIAKSASRLFRKCVATITMREGDQIQWRAVAGEIGIDPQVIERVKTLYPIPFDPETVPSAQAMLERRIVQILDAAAAGSPYTARVAQESGIRSAIFVPLVREDEGIGTIVLTSTEPDFHLSDKQLALLQTFADQAVIAIENVRLFHEIEDKNRQLEIANKHKSDFLANMSHELRTPLNAIIGFSEALAEKMFGELNEKQEDYLKDIHSSGKHLLSLINDILDLSKIEAGRMELDLAEVDLPSALSNAMTLVRERAERHGIALSLEVDPQVGAVQADERKVKQVVLNLLSNAVKFTPDGGRIAVRAVLDTDHVEVAVADTGVGIAEEDHKLVFEEFRQAGRDYTKKAEGTGLGLSLTRRIVELHGGRIWLQSEPGRGSTFTFTLPLRQGEAS